MKAVRIIAIALLVYVGIVAAFESLLGYYQPSSQGTIVITTTDADGETQDRVVSRLESNGELYVAANHWPRAWYRQALADPNVDITSGGERRPYLAVPVGGEEHTRVNREHPVGLVGRLLMGFPPRRFVRFDLLSGGEATVEDGAPASSDGHVFTYTTIDRTPDSDGVLTLLESTVLPTLAEAGAAPYSIWLPPGNLDAAQASDSDRFGRGFAGLGDEQLGVMLAWPEADLDVQALDDALSAVEGITAVATLTYDPLYLADGLQVPTGRGFYVHREERYQPEDAPEAVRLSRAAWETWEPAWGTIVAGVFQERGEPADVARLVRIVWYRDFQHWVTTRQGEPESRRFFRARSELQLEGSGVAIATDRLVR